MSSNLGSAAAVFAALGDPTRLAVLDRLSTIGPLSITRITAGTNISRQAITKHLHVLADAGLVRDVQRGRERYWEFEPVQLDRARRSLDQIARQWDQSLARLKSFVEVDDLPT